MKIESPRWSIKSNKAKLRMSALLRVKKDCFEIGGDGAIFVKIDRIPELIEKFEKSMSGVKEPGVRRITEPVAETKPPKTPVNKPTGTKPPVTDAKQQTRSATGAKSKTPVTKADELEDEVFACAAVTTKGKPCARNAIDGSRFCAIHEKIIQAENDVDD